jgi:hypothetical protein
MLVRLRFRKAGVFDGKAASICEMVMGVFVAEIVVTPFDVEVFSVATTVLPCTLCPKVRITVAWAGLERAAVPARIVKAAAVFRNGANAIMI